MPAKSKPSDFFSGDPLKPHDGPELVIGVVAPVGANLSVVCKVIETELSTFDYSSHTIRLSTLLPTLKPYENLSGQQFPTEHERVQAYMDAGTSLREKTRRGDIMAFLAVSKIQELRTQENAKIKEIVDSEKARIPLRRTAFILRSLKHPDEVFNLRSVYGRAFILVSAYSPREERTKNLAEIIARSASDSDTQAYRGKAEDLIWRDEQEQGTKLGQNVSDAFPLADLFIDTRSRDKIENSVSRFLEIFFRYPFHTPTRDEFAMFQAKAAALRSSDLSRQVGAAISTFEGNVVALGCNDVPSPAGGLYWPGDVGEERDFRRGYDSSARSKNDILTEILERFSKSGWLADEKNKLGIQALVKELLHGPGKGDGILKDTQILGLLEFGRPVHAEMAALMDAALRGVSVRNCTLFSTTFPCHICARHIIASGISRVVYIQPYPKSATKELYSDSVAVDPSSPMPGKVNFEPFVGIAPFRYMTLFELNTSRKDSSGMAVDWSKIDSNPQLKRYVLSYLLIEEDMTGTVLPEILKNNGIEMAGSA